MNVVLEMASRNVKIFVRNRAAVFYSFLSVLIIIGLYALFLGKVQVDGIRKQAGDVKGIRFLVDSWIMAGLLAVNTATTTLGALSSMVFDVEYRRFHDFVVAPVSRTSVVVSYLVSSWIIGLMFSLVALVAAELYIVSSGGSLLSPGSALFVVGMLALIAICSSSIMFFLASLMKTGTAFGTVSTLVGTLIGFIAGVYVPLGILPEAVQRLVMLVPFSHGAAMLRQVFCAPALAAVFKGAPPEMMHSYVKTYGISLFWGDREISMAVMVTILAAATVIFLVLSAMKLRRYGKG